MGITYSIWHKSSMESTNFAPGRPSESAQRRFRKTMPYYVK